MTREEAWRRAKGYLYDALDGEEADEIIKALEQEPSGDAVSRQAVLKTLDDMDNVLDEDRTIENYKELLKECYEVLPPVNPQEPKYCDRNICLRSEYNGIGCDECEVTKSQEPTDENLHREREQAYMQGYEDASKRFRLMPCEDAVSRSALISHIENQSREWGEDYDVQQILGDIEDMPSVNPQEKVGYWIPIEYPTGVEAFGVKEMSAQELQCSECGKTVDISDGDFKYCPYCKTRMVEEQERSE